MVCFVDKERPTLADVSALCTGGSPYDLDKKWPIACEGWKTERNNVYLIPDGSEAFDVGDIRLVTISAANEVIEIPELCVPVINNRMYVQLKGLGDRVQVSEYDPNA